MVIMIMLIIVIMIMIIVRGEFLSFFVRLFDTVIPFNSFCSVPVFSEEHINGSFLLSCSLSLSIFFTRWIRNAGASETQ